MEPFAKRPRVEGPGAVAIPAEEAITFHLVKKDKAGQAVLEEGGNFPPEMTHQLFGEKEEIVGYDGLSIDIWLTPQFQAFIDVAMAGKGPGATPLREPFQGAFAAGFFEEKEKFDKALQEEEPVDATWMGRELGAEATEEGSTFRVLHAQLAKADPKLKALHSRMEPLLYFFVDAASPIDPEDPDWHLLTAVEQSGQGSTEVLGYATCYRHYHYPAGCRLRLAQILVLPPHQRRGVGTMLLAAAQKLAEEMDACDLAFEEPAEALQALRTVMDVRRALALDWLPPAVQQRLDALASDKGKAPAGEAAAKPLANGKSGGAKAAKAAAAQHPLAPPPEVLERLRRELRLSKLQAVTVWRALLYVAGRGEAAVAEGVGSLIRGALVAQLAAAKEDAQGKGVRDTDKGFVMFRGAAPARAGGLPLLPVEEQSAEQQAEAVEEAAEQQLEQIQAVAARVLGISEGLEAVEEGDEDEDEDE